MKQLKLESTETAEQVVARRFEQGGVKPISIERRAYPDETIFVVRVSPEDFIGAGTIGNTIDSELANMGFKGFVTVRVRSAFTSSSTSCITLFALSSHDS
jgi:hypothetical protein